ncbi:MAG: hypothetical protein K2H43_00945, partial [Clostridia bacterium]|nr:hypothetical protein [Clostridia bacterium]
TFYDSRAYVRYDASLDEDGLGDPHGSYKQSTYSEQLIALNYASGNTTAKFIDFSAYNVTVPEDDLGNTDDGNTDDSTASSDTNVWLLISSGVMAGALVFVIIAVIVRRIVSAVKKNKKGPKRPKPTAKLKLVKNDEE